MERSEIRRAVERYCEDHEIEEGIIMLDRPAFDNSIVGITDTGRLVYDQKKMIEELMEDEDWTEAEAWDWMDYNTMRAIPYMGEGRPIIIECSKEELLDLYGDEAVWGERGK